MLGGRDDPLAKAAKLLDIGNVQEQLDQTDAVIDEHLFEGVDLVIGSLPLFWAGQSLDAFDQDPPVPGSVEDCDIPGRRQLLPKAPEKVATLLLWAGLADRPNLNPAWVEPLGQTLDRAALA